MSTAENPSSTPLTPAIPTPLPSQPSTDPTPSAPLDEVAQFALEDFDLDDIEVIESKVFA